MVEQPALIPQSGMEVRIHKLKTMKKKFFVYIFHSLQIDRYYVGMSTDPKKRLIYHNIGKSGNKRVFTKRANDWEIVYTRPFYIKIAALRFEKRIKRMKSRQFLRDLINTGGA